VAASAYYPLSFSAPSGATAILMVDWGYSNARGGTDNGYATPLGYADGVTSSAVALLAHTSGSLATFTLSGDLALSTAGITVPVTILNQTYSVAVTYTK